MNELVCKQAVDKFGSHKQIVIAIEELSELAKELCKYERGIGKLDNIAEEIADVEIMLTQLRYIFGVDSMIDGFTATKINRLKGLVEGR